MVLLFKYVLMNIPLVQSSQVSVTAMVLDTCSLPLTGSYSRIRFSYDKTLKRSTVVLTLLNAHSQGIDYAC